MDDGIHIDCTIAHAPWRRTKSPAGTARRAARAALAGAGVKTGACEISIVLSSDSEVQRLNAAWRGKDTPTNVLSFAAWDAGGPPSPEGGNALGDIILALETCRRDARDVGKPFEHHMAHLVVHGVLHLLGFDHKNDSEAEAMQAIETRVLSTMGIPDPYNPRNGTP